MPFLISLGSHTDCDTSVTELVAPPDRAIVFKPAASRWVADRAREDGRGRPRTASAGLSASDFRLVVVGHGYARLLRVLGVDI
jgi:hypothetical protein